MKAKYNHEDNVLILHLSNDAIDHTEEVDNVIMHLSSENKIILIEILDANEFVAQLVSLTAR